ncbi:MAG: hypothetical protein LBR81_10000 [Prevotellaceae bacterium]|jgi:hypothetical protein|nr:hypothetical protein [Prevotellaceae bacterium]
MSALVSDYPELAEKVIPKAKGYRMLDILSIINEYNEWYLQQGNQGK